MTRTRDAAELAPDAQRRRADPSGTVFWLDDPRASAPDRSGGRRQASWLPSVLGRLFYDVTPFVASPRPHDPTLAMGTRAAQLAESGAAAGTEPSRDGPGVSEFRATYGHGAPDREIDIGLARSSDDPTYAVELVRGCLRTGDPGELLARLLRSVLTRLRGLGGLRERPKF
jgi:hypothetical protein